MESSRGECERRIGEIKRWVRRMCKLTEVFWESVPKSWCRYDIMISITISIVLSDIGLPKNYLNFQQVTEYSVLSGKLSAEASIPISWWRRCATAKIGGKASWVHGGRANNVDVV